MGNLIPKEETTNDFCNLRRIQTRPYFAEGKSRLAAGPGSCQLTARVQEKPRVPHADLSVPRVVTEDRSARTAWTCL